jgi:hypothetical protein
VAAHDFEFAIDVTEPGGFDDLLRKLTGEVLERVGFAAESLSTVADPLKAAVAKALASARGCRVWFRRRGATLDIEVTSGTGRIWQVSRPIP